MLRDQVKLGVTIHSWKVDTDIKNQTSEKYFLKTTENNDSTVGENRLKMYLEHAAMWN